MKKHYFSKHSHKIGLPPGSLVYMGDKVSEKVQIHVIDYNEKDIQEFDFQDIKKTFPFRDTSTVTWINIDGLHDTGLIENVGNHFQIHPLVLEDIVNTDHRPKIDDMDSYLFINLKMIYKTQDMNDIQSEQVSLILGRNYVISFQEHPGDVFEIIRNRIRSDKGRIRKMGSDYLCYALMDAIIDQYYTVLEHVGDRIEAIEDEVLINPTTRTLQQLHEIKNRLLFLRKSIWPLREIINRLERGEIKLIKTATRFFFRDIFDHTIQILEMIETMRDMNSGMFDMYLSNISNRMNEVMKVLTIIATIFIPLTFIAGVYGMNFENMPELKWHWGYFGILGVMTAIAITLILFFKKRKWL